jgi:hypothetical protein
MAFFELLSGSATCLELPLSASCSMELVASPMSVTCPVTTALPNVLSDDAEEEDVTTLGNLKMGEDE